MSDRTILRKLLEIELHNFAVKLNLVQEPTQIISDELCLNSLNLLKDISNREESDFSRQLAIMIVALIWTHSRPDIKDDIRQIITPILSTLGFSPSNLMLDDSLRNEDIYSPISSYFDKLRIAVNDISNQVFVNKRAYTLTKFQADLWKALDTSNLLGVSAPTSAGKSFLLYLKIVDMISKGMNRFVYIVPTLSLISQVTSDLAKLLKEHQLYGINILNSYEREVNEFIYVVTQERAISLFSEEGINSIDLLVVDEIQNIEKVSSEGEDRSKILYDVLTDVRNDIEVGKILLSGPRLKNIGSLGFDIFGEESIERKTDSPPVFSITYSVSKIGEKHFLNQYSSAFSTPFQIKIENDAHIQGLGGVQYNEKFDTYLHAILQRLDDEVNIVFSPTSTQARRSAKSYSSKSIDKIEHKLESLSSYFKESVHPKYELAEIVESGVAYHTGKTPMHVRKTIEVATSEKIINTLFCTTTLMQGVNLPAKNIVIRNPNLFTRRRTNSAELSAYEFANLRGRAGRLLTDFIGRTIVLDESSFYNGDDQEQDSLFPEEHKEISTGYKRVYEQYSEEIHDTLRGEDVMDSSPAKGLVTYIRQILYRHGEQGLSRLKDVGLTIDSALLREATTNLTKLKVSREIVLANRYWDPIDLDAINDIYQVKKIALPTSVFQKGLYKYFLEWMRELRSSMPFYFERYLGNINDDNYMYGIAKSAESWAREIPLSNILTERFPNNTTNLDNKIDSEIDKLGKYVSFGLPMLLKPIADMGIKESSIISSIEFGIYSPLSKYLSDRGVPRETAIKISRHQIDPQKLEALENFNLDSVKKQLNYWELKQVEHLL